MKAFSTPRRVYFGPNRNTDETRPMFGRAIKTWFARLVLLALAAAGLYGGSLLATAIGHWMGWRPARSVPEQPALLAPARPSNADRIIKLCEKFSDRVAMHSQLPARSPLGWGLLGASQESNSVAMDRLVETLAMEIGASKVLGSIRTLREVEHEMNSYEALAKSVDPVFAAQAVAAHRESQAQAKQLRAFVRQELNKEGFDFTDEEIASLCASPNAEDLASMITAFGVLKKISVKMEQRLRMAPSQESAQRYYGGYTVLLLALDNIQKKGMDNINTIYIPKAADIRKEAEATNEEAVRMLNGGGLNGSERRALLWNIDSCQTTMGLADSTRRKLERNLDILAKANSRLALTIKTAKNSHTTALLQKEIIRLDARQSEEIAQIESLVIPELVGVRFADPTRPEVSRSREPQG
jgi:hypothetical protein